MRKAHIARGNFAVACGGWKRIGNGYAVPVQEFITLVADQQCARCAKLIKAQPPKQAAL